MSDHFLRLIPTSPTAVPSSTSQARALELLRSLVPKADRVHAEVHPAVTFIDSGSNFERVSCPACSADLTDRWSEWMSAAAASSFCDLSIAPDCCGIRTNLNALDYFWPQGFARFVLEAMNPKLGGPLPREDVRRLELVLECDLRQVLAHV
jgi:hypothetical protein